MSKAKIIRDDAGKFYGIRFICPGCAAALGAEVHGTVTLPVAWLPESIEESEFVKGRPHWSFNGDLDRPTFGPSVLSKFKQYMGQELPPKEHICHSYVRDGRIQFLPDSTHALAGQTVELPEIAA